MKKIAIIGGGITGLAAAYYLEKEIAGKEDHDYKLYEAENRLGGKILTERKEGFIIEGGPDTFVSTKPETIELANELGIGDDLLNSSEENKGTYIYSKGNMHILPDGLYIMIPTKFTPFVTTKLFSWPGKLRMAMDVVIPKGKTKDDETLASFVKRRLGQEALDKLAEPLVAGIHASDPETMSLKSTFPNFLDMEKNHRSLILAMMASKKKMAQAMKKSSSSSQAKLSRQRRTFFVSFKKGMAELIEAITNKVNTDKIILNSYVKPISRKENNGPKKYIIKTDGQEEEFDAVIITTPSFQAAKLVKDISESISNNLNKIPWSTSATINLVFKKEDIPPSTKGFGFVIPTVEKRKIMAGTFCSHKFAGRSPEDGFLIRTFVGGAQNQELVQLSDDELVKIALDELEVLIGLKAKPLFSLVNRWPKGMPQYIIGHQENVKEIFDSLNEIPGFYLAGGSYDGVGISDCIRTGRDAVSKALEYLGLKS